MISKLVVGLAASLVSFSALAVQKDITVTASVDTSVELTQADGTALPSAVPMSYRPGVGLLPVSLSTKIFSNDATKDMEMRLVNTPELVQTAVANPVRVALAVKYNNMTLSTAPTTLTAGEAFPGGDTTNGSIMMPLEIAQASVSPLTSTGNYAGMVSIALVQSTIKP